VAAVATLCQDERIFTAMIAAGTPCPVEGKIGTEAKEEWEKRGVTTKGSDIGFYANPTPKKSEVKKEQFICKDYAGNDPAVKERLGCK
jgi:hypothetical protein